jgi:hypothetical protein
MLRIICFVFLIVSSGCSAGPLAVVGSSWMATKYFYDKSPVDIASDFFSKRCESYSLYEVPAKCRSK